jgi:HAE1 family hydrophobic/amphiphilic exporter-1
MTRLILAIVSMVAITAAQTAERVFLLPDRPGIIGKVSITLEEAVAGVLANNRDIEISRIDRGIAGWSVTAARGAYDPRIGADTYWERSVIPIGSIIGGGPNGAISQTTATAVPQLTGLLPLGGTYSMSLSSTRLSSDNQFNTLNPQYPSAMTLTFTQPLFRNLLYDDARHHIEVARKNQAISGAQFRQRVTEVVTQAVDAYWDLVFATRNLDVQLEAVDLARRQVESNERMVKQGLLAPIDVTEAETQLDNFEQNAYTAQENLTRAENALKALMLGDRLAPVWSKALVPETPLNLAAPSVHVDEALSQAVAQRPEIEQVKLSRAINEADERYYREQTKPQVDLIATYVGNGLAGRVLPPQPNPLTAGTDAIVARINQLSQIEGLPPVPPISFGSGAVPPALVGGYGESLATISGWNFPTTHAGVRVSLPLRNRTAEANLGASVAQGRRIDTQRTQLEQLIEADVRNTIQSMDSAKARLGAASASRRSAEAQHESELRKFQAGTSTVFLVLQRQTAMINARDLEIRAQADLSKAIADYERATAATLESHSIDIQGQAKQKAGSAP